MEEYLTTLGDPASLQTAWRVQGSLTVSSQLHCCRTDSGACPGIYQRRAGFGVQLITYRAPHGEPPLGVFKLTQHTCCCVRLTQELSYTQLWTLVSEGHVLRVRYYGPDSRAVMVQTKPSAPGAQLLGLCPLVPRLVMSSLHCITIVSAALHPFMPGSATLWAPNSVLVLALSAVMF